MNINQRAHNCDVAIASGDEGELQKLSSELEVFLEGEVSREHECAVHYLLGNLNAALSRINNENATSWRDEKWSKYTALTINHFREAKTISENEGSLYDGEIKANLANELSHQRRSLEAMDYWQLNASIGDASCVSALSKGRELVFLSFYLNDQSHANLYQYEAYVLFRNLRDNEAEITHPRILDTIQNEDQVVSLLKFWDKSFETLDGWKNDCTGDSYSEDEKLYREWCLKNGLFANPINDLTDQWIADQDILQFPNHVVAVKDGPYFSAAFSALKREYCFARFMAFEGVHQMHPNYEGQNMFLTDTLDSVHYEGSIEKIKTAFRVCFSVFDSLASLMNVYFGCNAKRVSFSSRWIRENLKDENNYFIDALYWLSCDLSDVDLKKLGSKWKAPNPAAAEIRRVRNAIEHGWLRVAEFEETIWDSQNDFAYQINPQDLERHTMTLLQLVRSAMLYLCMAVVSKEKSKPKKEGGVFPVPINLVDDDFL